MYYSNNASCLACNDSAPDAEGSYTVLSDPRISVAILSHNFRDFIGEAIESVLAQTLRPYEIIICDDCSSDDSWEIIESIRKRYPDVIKPFRPATNIGIAKNTNFAISKFTCELACWMDGDDLWMPRKLEAEWNALRDTGAGLAYSTIALIDADGRETAVWDNPLGGAMPKGDVFIPVYARALYEAPNGNSFRNPLAPVSYHTQFALSDERLESFMDWDIAIRLTSRFRVAHSGEPPAVKYRRHAGGFSMSNKERHHRGLKEVYEKNLRLLKGRRPEEALKVICRIEALISKNRASLKLPEERVFYAPEMVVKRNSELIAFMPRGQRGELEAELEELKHLNA